VQWAGGQWIQICFLNNMRGPGPLASSQERGGGPGQGNDEESKRNQSPWALTIALSIVTVLSRRWSESAAFQLTCSPGTLGTQACRVHRCRRGPAGSLLPAPCKDPVFRKPQRALEAAGVKVSHSCTGGAGADGVAASKHDSMTTRRHRAQPHGSPAVRSPQRGGTADRAAACCHSAPHPTSNTRGSTSSGLPFRTSMREPRFLRLQSRSLSDSSRKLYLLTPTLRGRGRGGG